MRITHPLWPAVREFSRRLLREDGLVLSVNEERTTDVNQLLLAMADLQPERLVFPSVIGHPTAGLTLHRSHEDGEVLLGQSSVVEPPMNVLWLPMEANEALDSILEAAHDLLQAGYPGCVGCAGSVDETAWDEATHRQRWRVHISNTDGPPLS